MDGRELRSGASVGRLSRRAFVKRVALLTGAAAGGFLIDSIARPAWAAPKRGGVLNFGLILDPPRLDPATHAYLGPIDLITSVVYDRLVDYTPDTSGLLPSLAERWENSPDGKTYTFFLRKGVKWHNGRDLTAEDVTFSFRRLLDPKTAAPYAPVFGPGIDIRSIDRYTVRFVLPRPNAAFMALVALPATSILNREFVEAGGHDPATTMMGTGPFRLQDYQRGVHLRLVRHESYRIPGRPYLDGITFRFLPDDTARVSALRTKTVDMIDFVPEAQMRALETTPGIRLHTDKKVSIIMFAMRQDPPFDDIKVRQALSSAVDRQAVLRAALYGRGEIVTGGVLWEGHWAHSTEVKQIYTYDPARAKRLLAEAGYPNGFKKSYVVQAAPRHRNAAVAIQAGFKAVGVDIELKVLDPASAKQRQTTGDFELTGEVVIETYADPDFLWSFFHSQSLWGRNLKVRHDQLDSWLDQAREITDRARRKTLYTQIQKQLMETVPIVLLVRREWGDGGWDHVKNYSRFPGLAWQGMRAAEWWLDR